MDGACVLQWNVNLMGDVAFADLFLSYKIKIKIKTKYMKIGECWFVENVSVEYKFPFEVKFGE